MRATTGSLALLGLAAPALVHCSPVNLVTQLQCLAVEIVVDALGTYGSATPFCSSFLSIPTITKTATATSSIPTTTAVTTTTGTSTITADTVTVSETATSTLTTCILSAVQKRHLTTTSSTSTAKTTSMVSSTRPGTSSSTTITSKVSPSTGLPSCVASFATSQISTACSCLSIPTPSVTVTNTVTATPVVTNYVSVAATATTTPTTTVTVTSTLTDIVCPTPTQCGNQGIQWAEYPNTQGDNTDNTYSAFNPAVYKTESPNISGVTSTIGGINAPGAQEITIYGNSQQFYSDYFALNHRGYFFAVVTGTYTISFSDLDDTAFLWYGPTAYSGWTRDNANLIVSYHQGVGPGSGSTTVDLVAGEYLPIRIVFAQGQGGAIFQVSVADPDGTVFLDSSTANSPYVVQYSCDGVTAPAYPAFGSES